MDPTFQPLTEELDEADCPPSSSRSTVPWTTSPRRVIVIGAGLVALTVLGVAGAFHQSVRTAHTSNVSGLPVDVTNVIQADEDADMDAAIDAEVTAEKDGDETAVVGSPDTHECPDKGVACAGACDADKAGDLCKACQKDEDLLCCIAKAEKAGDTEARGKCCEANPDNRACKCSKAGTGCMTSGCCQDAALQCFRKDAHWADCRETCTKGWINPDAPKKYQTPWSCEPAFPCSFGHENCGLDGPKKGVCCDKSKTCYKKDDHWAACLPTCEAGKTPDWTKWPPTWSSDGDDNKWDCAEIKPE